MEKSWIEVCSTGFGVVQLTTNRKAETKTMKKWRQMKWKESEVNLKIYKRKKEEHKNVKQTKTTDESNEC